MISAILSLRTRMTPLFTLVLTACLLSCSSKTDEPDCVPASTDQAKPMTMTRTQVRVDPPESMKDANWCQACVLGPKGWASCQAAYALKEGENEEAIKARAHEKACLDAGYDKGQCPAEALIRAKCKNDPKPEKTVSPSKALQDIFYGQQKKKTKESPTK